MLKVPELNPGDVPFDPELHYQTHPKLKRAEHALSVGDASDGPERRGAILWNVPDGDGTKAGGEAADRELEAVRRRNALFDDANLRNVLTDMHARGNEFEEGLAKLSGPEVGEIIERAEAFLKSQWRDLQPRLTTERQRRRFEQAFAAFCGTTHARARSLQEHKTLVYRREVTERQNAVFMEQALRVENLFNDRQQTVYRDMCLLNLENLHEDLPEGERREKLDAASAEFCRRVLDKRLELDPARMRTMLDAPAVRRVLGDEALARYEGLAAAAVRNADIRDAARQWAEDGKDPDDAALAATKTFRNADERTAATAFYREFRERDSRQAAAKNLTAIDEIWREVAHAGAGGGRRLEAVRNSDPGLALRLEKALDGLRKTGGAPLAPDYLLLLELTDNFDPFQEAERLRDRHDALDVFLRLGGPEAEALGVYLRFYRGEAGDVDARLVENLRLARDAVLERNADKPSNDDMRRFLALAVENIRIATERGHDKGLDVSERREAIVRAMEDMGWQRGENGEKANREHQELE